MFAEENNLQKLKHPNIIRLYNVFKLNQVVVFMLEYLPGGDLRHYLKNKLDTKNSDEF
jgi:serine/threonine protein kinase